MAKTQTQKTKPFQIFTDTCDLLDISPTALSDSLGYDRSAHYGWRVKGLMPEVAANLCIYMQERACASPTNTARLTRLWPMFSSTRCGTRNSAGRLA